jgi:ribosomal-protein-alanine N-acetyltransferase
VEFTLRDAQPDDFETLWQIDQKCFPPGIAYSRLELAAYIQRRKAFTVAAETAVQDGRGREMVVAGFIVAESNRREEGHIITIDVLPAYRRSGLGSKLLLAAEERLRAVPCRKVLLETAVDNSPAIAFYKQHGYHIVRTIPRYYPDNVNALVLQKDLSVIAGRDALAN